MFKQQQNLRKKRQMQLYLYLQKISRINVAEVIQTRSVC